MTPKKVSFPKEKSHLPIVITYFDLKQQCFFQTVFCCASRKQELNYLIFEGDYSRCFATA